MKQDERDQLIDDLLDGAISDADFLRLEAEMHVSAETRTAYYERVELDLLLHEDAEDSEDVPDANRVPLAPTVRFNLHQLAMRAAAVAVLAATGWFGWLAGRGGEDAPTAASSARTEVTAAGFGVIGEQTDAVWEEADLERGDLLPQGELHLKSGAVQLELFSGVMVIVEGDARFEIASAMEMSVDHGRIRAHVPEPAQGFRIVTASGEVVDLGTEFGLEVTPERTELHVLDGEVEWHSESDAMRRLVGGEAIRSENGASAPLAADTARFAGIADLEKRSAERRHQRHAAWRWHSERLKSDPRLLAYFPMTQAGDWQRRLTDASAGSHDGTIVRARRVADRWENSGAALDFSPTGSRVRMNVPGQQRSLTLLCWAKIDSLDRWYNSLFLTDGHELHEPHWQIMDDGRLFFSVKAHDTAPHKHIFYSPPIWSPAVSGKWQQIATVYDVDSATVTHYLNGEAISSEAVPDGMQVENVSIGAASIGNWSEPYRSDPHFAVRNLNGVIDEFALFSEALGADEIAKLYEIGRP